ncbi:fungal-specific transcription factor domain-containing protein [Xylariales sp. PMI_506]|nr:fungal-specific transcription factor domain-containing protein [Xylariales sp. PMI_506]
MDTPAAIRRRRRRRVPDDRRKRAPRACDRCKARKSKCIEVASGICRRCQQNSLSCRFEREKSPVESPSASAQHQPLPQPLEVAIVDNVPESSPHNAAQTSPEGNYSIDSHPTERFMWPRFLSRLRETFSLDSNPVQGEVAMAAMQGQVMRTPLLQPDELRRLRRAVDAFPPRSVADFLLSVCIDHGTDAFFYFNQAQFLAEIDQFYNDPSSRLRSDCSFVCLAHAAFALGSQWTTLTKPEGSAATLAPGDSDPGRIFYNQARSLIPDVIDLPSLRSVQAPFVMGVYLLPASAIGSSYVYLGLALRKALALDLHLNADELNIGEEEKEIRRRIWWSIYSLERSSTVKLNRPRSINTNIITVSLPQIYPPLDDVQIFNNIEHQIADARLMMILDRVAEPSEWATEASVPNVSEQELKEWKRTLPPSLKLQNIHPQSSYYRSTFHLYSNYYFTWIAMGKVSLVTLVRARLRYQFGREAQPPQVGDHVESLSRSCIKAAKKMLQLFEELRRTGNLTRFSFTDFQGCSIATIVLLLASILDQDLDFVRHINVGLDCLRKMAEGNTAAKMGVSFVEALQSIANEAVEKLQRTQPRGATGSVEAAPVTGGQPPLASNYNGWVEWLSKQYARDAADTNGDSPPTSSGLGLPDHGVPTIPGGEAWPQPQSSVTPFTTWDGAAALQQLSVPAFAGGPLNQTSEAAPYLSSGFDSDFLSILYNDDQTFLMGLTGLDVLGFSELQE